MRVRARVQPGRARAAARRISLAKLLPFVGVTGSVPGCGCGSDSGSAPATGAHAGDIRRGQRLSTGDEGARYFARAAHGRGSPWYAVLELAGNTSAPTHAGMGGSADRGLAPARADRGVAECLVGGTTICI